MKFNSLLFLFFSLVIMSGCTVQPNELAQTIACTKQKGFGGMGGSGAGLLCTEQETGTLHISNIR
ncbi:MAG: hypothetical protein OEZ43_18365 [Gammaproteobacteria bacterium]|nr:hypothetical protein [Gammaproteobacteria bacterium]